MYVQGIFPKDQGVITVNMIFELPGVHRCVWEIEKKVIHLANFVFISQGKNMGEFCVVASPPLQVWSC